VVRKPSHKRLGVGKSGSFRFQQQSTAGFGCIWEAIGL